MALQQQEYSLDAFFSNDFQLWIPYSRVATDVINTSIIRKSQLDITSKVRHEEIPPQNLDHWLSELCDENSGMTRSSHTCRIVWIQRDTMQKIDHVAECILSQIIKAFNLEGILERCFTMMVGAQAFPVLSHRTRDPIILRYSFGMHPKLVTVWSVDVARNLVSAIVFAAREHIHLLKKLLHLSRERYDMIMPIMYTAVLITELDQTQERIKSEIRTVEARTGFHKWTTRTESPAVGDLRLISASLSGFSTKLAAVERKTKVIKLLLDFVVQQGQTSGNYEPPGPLYHELQDVENLRMRNFAQDIDACFIQRRLDAQLKSVSYLVAEHDAMSNNQIAQESKVIAMASQRDSSSVKILATVTVIYLPSQVIASIFDMSLFNWTAGQGGSAESNLVNDRFYIYWATTVPLTLITFGVALGWLYFEKRFRQDLNVPDQRTIDVKIREGAQSEIADLIARRSRTMTE